VRIEPYVARNKEIVCVRGGGFQRRYISWLLLEERRAVDAAMHLMTAALAAHGPSSAQNPPPNAPPPSSWPAEFKDLKLWAYTEDASRKTDTKRTLLSKKSEKIFATLQGNHAQRRECQRDENTMCTASAFHPVL
jgi:hypothetical protein